MQLLTPLTHFWHMWSLFVFMGSWYQKD